VGSIKAQRCRTGRSCSYFTAHEHGRGRRYILELEVSAVSSKWRTGLRVRRVHKEGNFSSPERRQCGRAGAGNTLFGEDSVFICMVKGALRQVHAPAYYQLRTTWRKRREPTSSSRPEKVRDPDQNSSPLCGPEEDLDLCLLFQILEPVWRRTAAWRERDFWYLSFSLRISPFNAFAPLVADDEDALSLSNTFSG